MNYRERYLITKKDRRKAEEWVAPAARRLGLVYYHQLNTIAIYSSEEKNLAFNLDLEQISLVFNFSSLAREGDYLRRIQFDVGGRPPDRGVEWQVEWQVSETVDDPPPTLEEFLFKGVLKVKRRASNPLFESTPLERISAFFEAYSGIYTRLFPRVEHEDLHTDVVEEDY